MQAFHSIPTGNSLATEARDFDTYEDDLPPAVVVSPGGIRDTGSYMTEVKQETTDEK